MLLAACIVPATIAVVALFMHADARERAGIERASQDVARALMQAIDRELSSARAALEALATSRTLDMHDLGAFRAQAAVVLSGRPGNVLVMSDASGRQLVNTGVAEGVPLPLHGNPAGVRQVVASARPMVSDLYLGRTVNLLLSSVDVPVVRDGTVRYVLSMQYVGERLGAILEQQKIPPGATITIHDGAARIVWSSRGQRSEVGQRASATLAAGFALGPEGMVDENDLPDGARVTVFSRSSLSNWVVAIALERSMLTASFRQSLGWIVLGVLGLLAMGGALVTLIGTRIATAVRALVRPAIALGHGEQVVLPPLHLDEAQDVGHALVQTAALLRQRTLERDEAERAERTLREAKRVIERSEAFMHGIFEETPDGTLLVGQDGRVTRVNVQAERLFGYPHGQLEGMALDALLIDMAPAPVGAPDGAAGMSPGAEPQLASQFAPKFEPKVESMSARLRAAAGRDGMLDTTRIRGRRQDGAVFPVDVMVNTLTGPALLIVTVRDVSSAWRQEQALRQALDDKNILLRELYHRVKNNLQLIISLFDLQVRTVQDPGAQQALVEAAGRVRAMALVHERLNRPGTLGLVDLHDYIGELCDQLARGASARQRGIAMTLDVMALAVPLDIAVPLGLLLNELVSNSLKHAFPDGRSGTIRVVLATSATPDTSHCLIVQDDGIGLPPTADRTSTETLGLRLVGALSDGLHARLTLENRCGACITVAFRMPATDDASTMSSAPVCPAPESPGNKSETLASDQGSHHAACRSRPPAGHSDPSGG